VLGLGGFCMVQTSSSSSSFDDTANSNYSSSRLFVGKQDRLSPLRFFVVCKYFYFFFLFKWFKLNSYFVQYNLRCIEFST